MLIAQKGRNMEYEEKDLFGYMDDAEDETQPDVVDQDPDYDATDEGAELETEVDAVDNSADGIATHQQTFSENQIAAAARKAAEQQTRNAQAERDAAIRERDALLAAVGNYGYQGSAQEIADMLTAKATGRTAEDVAAERAANEALLNQMVEHHPAIQQARAMMQTIADQSASNQLSADLRKIQAINPEIKSLGDLHNLGESQRAFDLLVGNGMRIDEAYMAVCGTPKQAVRKPDTKSHIGMIGGNDAPQSRMPGIDAESMRLAEDFGFSDKEITGYINSKRKK